MSATDRRLGLQSANPGSRTVSLAGHALTPGSRLLDYELIEQIGEGGMGVVWKAEDTKLQREVAIKDLPAEVGSSPERLGRFEREAIAVAALNHPNIVTTRL